jgi:hypothetical protein
MSLAMIAPPDQSNQGLVSMLTLQSSTMPDPGTQGNAKRVWVCVSRWATSGSVTQWGKKSDSERTAPENPAKDSTMKKSKAQVPVRPSRKSQFLASASTSSHTFSHPYRPSYGANIYQPLLETPLFTRCMARTIHLTLFDGSVRFAHGSDFARWDENEGLLDRG